MRYGKPIFQVSLSVILASCCLGAFAQSIPSTVPSSGQTLQDLERKTVPSVYKTETSPKLKPPSSDVEDNNKPKSLPEEKKTPQKVFIREIHLEGSTLIKPAEAKKLISAYENHEDTFGDLQILANQLTKLYQTNGYVTSRVYIPPQKLQDGTLILQAVEGRVGSITVKNGTFFRARSVRPHIGIKTGTPFDVNTLKRNLRVLNENPDRNVRAVLKPGEKTGDTDVELDLTDRLPFHMVPTFDNLGRYTLGNNRTGLRLSNTNIFGNGDTLLSSLSFTRKSFGVVDNYQIPLGTHGTKFVFNHAYSYLKVGGAFENSRIRGRALTFSPQITQDIINKERYKVYADLAFIAKNLSTDADGVNINRDRLRILRPGINFEEYDRWGRTFMRHESEMGIDLFNATSGFQSGPPASRYGAGSKFFRYTGSIIRTQKMPFHSYAIFRAIGQLSPDRLVSSEQFQIGGTFTVRGYKEGTAIGDNGLLLSSEWRIPFFLLPRSVVLPGSKYSLRDNVQIVPFLDYGVVNTNDPAAGVVKSHSLMGTGIGLRAQLTKYMVGRIDFGYALIHIPNNNFRVHFGVESNVF